MRISKKWQNILAMRHARDHIDLGRPVKAADLLGRFTSLQGKKVLEIGSGFGITLATWIKQYQLDGYGTERDAEGFGSSFKASRERFRRKWARS